MVKNELTLNIVKTSFDKESGEFRWVAQASSTDLDLDTQRASIELFKSFIAKIEGGLPVRAEDRLPNWEGPMPYLSVSHFANEAAIVGFATSIYIDGKYLKAKGYFVDNETGMLAYKSVSKSTVGKEDRPIRISISWRDFAHKHDKTEDVYDSSVMGPVCPFCKSQGSQHITFLDGQIIHLALTRMPANVNTNIETLNGVEKMDGKFTQKQLEDAASIVGEDKADEMAQLEVQKTHEDTAPIVTKAEETVEKAEETVPSQPEEAVEKAAAKKPKKEDMEDEEDDKKKPMEEDEEEEEDDKKKPKKMAQPDELDLAVEQFTAIVRGEYPDLVSHQKAVNDAYQQLNVTVTKVAQSVHQEPEHVAKQFDPMQLREEITNDITQIFEKRFEAFQSAVTQTLQKSISNVNAIVTDLPANKEEKQVEQIPERISNEFRPPIVKQQGSQPAVSQFRRIANATTGLPANTQ